MVVSLVLAAALAGGRVDCTRMPSCHHEPTFKCPPGPNWKRTAQGCWDGHKMYVYRYTTKRTSFAVVGNRRHSQN